MLRRMIRSALLVELVPNSAREPIENGIARPTMKRKAGKIMSVAVAPFHSA
jgi:hypothetical protein